MSSPSSLSLVAEDDFMHTNDFRIFFCPFVTTDKLMKMRVLCKAWRAVADKVIDREVESGALVVHGGNDITIEEANSKARKERMKQVTKVVFLLNITKVGKWACWYTNLVVVEIPEGV